MIRADILQTSVKNPIYLYGGELTFSMFTIHTHAVIGYKDL